MDSKRGIRLLTSFVVLIELTGVRGSDPPIPRPEESYSPHTSLLD
jgi:hypothetical protein